MIDNIKNNNKKEIVMKMRKKGFGDYQLKMR
jgi:hypothetical protein